MSRAPSRTFYCSKCRLWPPANARKALSLMPAWGQSAVTVRGCTVRPGSNGKPDYIIGEVCK